MTKAERPAALAARLRPAGGGDAERLSLVGRATFLETFAGVLDGDGLVAHCLHRHAPDVYAGWLQDGVTRTWLAEAEGGAPVGYAVLGAPDLPVALQPDDAELKRIYVLGRAQGTGLGRRLMDAVLQAARDDGRGRVLLGVYLGNQGAIDFYRKAGFTPVGERRFQVGRRFYDDVVLARRL